ncbi:MAG TPA: hypothetical protein VGZ00_09175 [Candidatus Baltobacteraceae bacterium]|nr:hypothetical protein [Candidatus Baltobacteraceae bacterium]
MERSATSTANPVLPIGEVAGTVPAALTALVLPATTQADLGKKLTPGAYRSWQARRKGRVRGVPPHPTKEGSLLQPPFVSTPEALAELEEALSCDRLSPYLIACTDDRRRAIDLYEWNSKVSAAFYILLQTVEVTLRNACHRELTSLFGPTWYDERAFLRLDANFPKALDEANVHIQQSGATVDTPRLVAELHFGFWTRLLSPHLETTLWVPALWKAFPRFRQVSGTKISRHPVSKRFTYLRRFRNRIAHHEPIFDRVLVADNASLLEAIAWSYPSIAEWTDGFSQCADLIAAKPQITP